MFAKGSRRMSTVRITYFGIVQGVGFRPFVSGIAKDLGLTGQVKNMGSLVEILLTGSPYQIQEFEEEVARSLPPGALLLSQEKEELLEQPFTDFTIEESDVMEGEAVLVPPDRALCHTCLSELYQKGNRRYGDPFISCAQCGPRFSIIDELPYDRVRTSMNAFQLCASCREEYEDESNRRFHAETISCQICGPVLSTIQGQVPNCQVHQALDEAASLLNQGKILGLKGLGGYYFVCNPFNKEALKELRKMKQRDSKPFALMFRDAKQVEAYCILHASEAEFLQSPARPIVLLDRKPESMHLCPLVVGANHRLGAFLPSIGLQALLLDRCSPLVMTSANQENLPIVTEETELFSKYGSHLADVLYHDRKIKIRQDDSVLQVALTGPQFIRRSKGYVPLPIRLSTLEFKENALSKGGDLLATGGQQKSVFCLVKNRFAYLSPFLGDLDTIETETNYADTVAYLEKLLHVKPKQLVYDLHPTYFTTQYGKRRFLEQENSDPIELIATQHHHAHIASVMAEQGLIGPIIGVAMDGTGYGDDGSIWGGEILLCQMDRYLRVGHLESIPLLGGDDSMTKAWRTAMGYLYHNRESIDLFRLSKDERYETVKIALDHRIHTIQNSSMGRLFDAVCALLGIAYENRFEGQCASLLETCAYRGLRSGKRPLPMSFSLASDGTFSAGPLLESIGKAMRGQKDKEEIALGFHYAVAAAILASCQRVRELYGTDQVAFSGGVFQNRLLLERAADLCKADGFSVYWNRMVPPNDGGLCFGQAYLGMLKGMGESSCVLPHRGV